MDYLKTFLYMEAPRGKQRGIFDPKGEKSIRIRASNPRPKGRGMRHAVRVQQLPEENFSFILILEYENRNKNGPCPPLQLTGLFPQTTS